MDFLKLHNPQRRWIDSHVVLPCLAANIAVHQSSTYVTAGLAACFSHAGITNVEKERLVTFR